MTQFAIKRTGCNQADATQVQYFSGSRWSTQISQASAYRYEEAVSRIIVMNVLDADSRYEAVLCAN